MAKRVFLKKECKDVYEYIGHCPSCGREQNDMSERGADAMCVECMTNAIDERILTVAESPNRMIGAIVVSYTHVGYDYIEIELIDKNMEIYHIYATNPFVSSGVIQNFIDVSIGTRCNRPTTAPERNWTVEIWKKLRAGNKS